MQENKPVKQKKSMAEGWKRRFALIYAGQAFSLIGSSAVQFAMIWWLTVETDSAISLTIASILGLLPQALIGPFAGVFIDRYSKKTMMILADGFVAICSLALFFVLLTGYISVWLVYVILFLRAIGSTIHSPALQSAVPLFVPQERLVQAGGWGQLVNAFGNILGPVLGATFLELFGLKGIMLIDVGGAAFAIICLLCVSLRKEELSDKKEHPKVMHDLLDGVKLIARNKSLLVISLCALVATILYQPISSLLPLLVRTQFAGTAWHNSVAQTLFAGGFVLGAVILGIWGGLKRRFAMITLSIALLGVFIAISGLLPAWLFWLFAILALCTGFAGTFFSVPYMAYVQSTVPENSLGKVTSLMFAISSLAAPIGLIVAGPVSEAIGVSAWFFYSGCVLVIAGLAGFFVTRKHEVIIEKEKNSFIPASFI